MQNKIFIKPTNPDVIVANPDNKGLPLAKNGESVFADKYWRRRIKDGDVVVTKPVKPSK